MRTTTRRAALATAALAGMAVGVVTTMALTDPGTPRRASGEEPQLDATTRPTAQGTTTTVSNGPAVLLVWTSGGLLPGFDVAVTGLDGVSRLTMVRGDETAMTASSDASGQPVDVPAPGWHLPIDTLAIDPSSFSTFLTGDARQLVRSLGPGEALLTESSAALRRLGFGATIRLRDADLKVVGVIDDLSGAGAELLVAAVDAERLGVTTPRYVLVAYTGEREALQRAISDHLGGGAVRFRSPAETTWMRHGDAVEPPLIVKGTFGEFAVRDRAGRDVEIDPAWIDRWIVTEQVPILGAVTCHRKMIEPLWAAMADLEQASLAHLVDPSDFAGCFAARRIATGQPLSHHAWGAAVDLNVDGNPRGSFSTQDPRLVETMLRHGFTWGGTWLVPDPSHYEAPV
ncbi:MAG: M15 family metallopeptidase [Acidimicrobiales bacterium]